MIAYKFLSPGAVGPYTRFRWPVPGPSGAAPWVEARDARPDHGIHACRVPDLAFWQEAELWRTELDGRIEEGQRHLVAERARLLERVDGWNAVMSRSFGEACAWRARDRSVQALRTAGLHGDADRLAGSSSLDRLLVDARQLSVGAADHGLAANLASYLAEAVEFLADGDTPCSTYISARAAVASSGQEAEFSAEREAQGQWLAEALGL